MRRIQRGCGGNLVVTVTIAMTAATVGAGSAWQQAEVKGDAASIPSTSRSTAPRVAPAPRARPGGDDAGPDTGSGGAGPVTGSGGAPGGSAGSSGGCPALASFTWAEHIVMNVTWPNTLGTTMGTGQVRVWAKSSFTASGNNLSGTSQACGSVLPPTGLNAIAGGGNVLIQIPDATWDLPSMPRFQFPATQTGWGSGSTISYTSTALIGLTLADPSNAAWPDPITTAVDADNDIAPGYTAIPATGGGRVMPPVAVAFVNPPRADRVDLATRNVFMVTATRNACDHATGPITVVHFDSHVVGCHVSGGSDCITGQANFVDQNRTIYQAAPRPSSSKLMPATATCAEVRAALPLM